MTRYLAALLFLSMIGAASAGFAADADRWAVPPSPFSDAHGVYDDSHKCWVWDAAQIVPMTMTYQSGLVTDRACDGAVLEGPATVSWTSGPHALETWEGTFTAGKFTGRARKTFGDGGGWEGHYAAGLREGTAMTRFSDGQFSELTYVAGEPNGPFHEVFADGSSRRGNGKDGVKGGKTCFRDGGCYTADARFTPDGKAVPGLFHPPELDRASAPPLAYPPISLRLNEQGTVFLSGQVDADGTAHDMGIVRSSGWMRLDAAAQAWVTASHFQPATQDGVPVASQALMPVQFHIRN